MRYQPGYLALDSETLDVRPAKITASFAAF
jgi:hypothetical protein